MPTDDSNWFERRAAEVHQRAIARRRRPRDRQVIGRFTGVDAEVSRERLAPGQLADVGAAAPVNPPAVLPIDRAADAARLQYQHDALQRAAGDLRHTGPVGPVDFRGTDWD